MKGEVSEERCIITNLWYSTMAFTSAMTFARSDSERSRKSDCTSRGSPVMHLRMLMYLTKQKEKKENQRWEILRGRRRA